MRAKFWIVRDPVCTLGSSIGEFVFETTPEDHVKYALGTGLARYEAENHRSHSDRDSALEDFFGRLSKCVDSFASGERAQGQTAVLRAVLRAVDPSSMGDEVRRAIQSLREALVQSRV